MDRLTFQRLSKQRRQEGAVLLRSSHYAGSFLLMGYAVECALKACICRRSLRDVFPRRDAHKLYTHDLAALRGEAGLANEMDADEALAVNWATVKDWKVESARYSEAEVGRALALDYYTACTARRSGVLTWMRSKW